MTHAAAFAGLRRRRPPEVEVQLDLNLRNEADQARWAIVSDTLGSAPRPGELLLLDAYELTGEGRAVVLHGIALEGFFALLLPAGGQVQLRGLPLTHHGALPDRAAVEVVLSAGLEGHGFEMSLESDARAAVDASELAAQETVVDAQAGPLTVSWKSLETSRVEVALG